MIHEPLIAGGMGGSATSVKKTAENILEVKALINELLSRHTGKSAGRVAGIEARRGWIADRIGVFAG